MGNQFEKSDRSEVADKKKYEAEKSGIFAKSREAIKQVDIVISVSNLGQLITEKLPGERLYYKNLAQIVRRENGSEWQDMSGKKLPDIQKYLAEKDKSAPLNSKILDAANKLNDEQKRRFLNTAENDMDIFKLQSNMDFARMAAAFLKKGEGYAFTVDLKGNSKFELYVGLGHILPPSIRKVSVTDTNGRVRVGYRDIRSNRVGYFDSSGYMPVFSGYKVCVLETVDENSVLYKKFVQQEKDFYYGKRMMVYSEAGEGQTVDDFLRQKDTPAEIVSVYKKDWGEMQKILNVEKMKVDPDTILLDAHALRGLSGRGAEMLKNERTLALLRRFVKKGYEFRISDLALLNRWATDHEGQKEFQALDKKLGDARFEEFEKSYSTGQGVTSLTEAEKLPLYRRRIAENGLPFKTPSDYLHKIWRNRQGISAAQFGKIRLDLYRNGTVLGSLECARFVGEMLGLTYENGFTKSAGALFTSLLKGGGRLITDPKDLQPGDVLFMRGTSRNIWDMISHASLVIGKRGNKAVLRHHRGRKLGVVTSEFPSGKDSYRKFYGAVRPNYTPAQLDVFKINMI